jgi:large repetitive protein
MKPFSALSTAKRVTLVVALLGVLGAAAGLAFAKSGPPSPAISSGPANPTTSTSATFTFSDSAKNVTFVCSLDGSAFTACSSPMSYSGVSEGQHKFSVEARDSSGNLSGATSYSWRVDRTPPAISVTFPANGSVSNTATWSSGCSRGPGICGTATDPSGVAIVILSIKQNSSGKYWDGSSYGATGETWQLAIVQPTSSGANWFYPLARPATDGQYTIHVLAMDSLGNFTPSNSPATSTFGIDTAAPPPPSIGTKPADPTSQTSASLSFTDAESGVSYLCKLDNAAYGPCTSPASYSSLKEARHTFSVEARDAAGNVSSATSYSWTVDTTPPPAPTITTHPPSQTTSDSASFAFTDKQSAISFQCHLDTAAWSGCSSPATYNSLANGSHTFYVRAVDAAGNASGAASYTWSVQSTTGMPFTINGDVPNPLYPGASAQVIPVTLTNPNNVPIYVTSLSASLQSTSAAGCNTSWFQTGAANIPSGGITVPANGQTTVPAADAPTLKMLESGTNQDACKGASLTLTYTGSAHS